jgi:peptidoglycan/LPS O-acetylase OafA/YrhL
MGIFVYHALAALPNPTQRWPAQALLIGSVSTLAVQSAINVNHVIVPLYDLLFGGVTIALALGAGQWLVNGAIRYLGKISYSVYLIHFTMLAPAARAASLITEQPVFKFWLILAATTALSGLAATATYYLIESNGIRLGHAIARRIAVQKPEPMTV